MPDAGEKTTPSAGISPAGEVDVQALFERLKQEVMGRPSGGDGAAPVSARLTARAEAERLWPVAFDRPFDRRPGVRGFFAYPVKRLLLRLMGWYVQPFPGEQLQ